MEFEDIERVSNDIKNFTDVRDLLNAEAVINLVITL